MQTPTQGLIDGLQQCLYKEDLNLVTIRLSSCKFNDDSIKPYREELVVMEKAVLDLHVLCDTQTSAFNSMESKYYMVTALQNITGHSSNDSDNTSRKFLEVKSEHMRNLIFFDQAIKLFEELIKKRKEIISLLTQDDVSQESKTAEKKPRKKKLVKKRFPKKANVAQSS